MALDILLIGGDGDLAIRKLYPALVTLESAGQLGNVGTITAVSRNADSTEELLDKMLPNLKGSDGFCEKSWESFKQRFGCLKGDASSPEVFNEYQKTLPADSDGVVVYLAVPPKVFGGACRALKAAGLAIDSTRLVIEKPLGSDRESFRQLNEEMRDGFAETQIYRIDHYLGKESVQNLLALRFANQMIGSLWSGNQIDHVQITIAEEVGLEGRSDFYEEVGAMRDMVQNHLLQVMCLLAMEPPASHDAEMIRAEKYKVLRCLKPITGDDINRHTVRGQYVAGEIKDERLPSYEEELGKPSNTETFVSIRAEIDNWRWTGVPFYLRTGKRMPTRTSEIVIQLKSPKHNIFGKSGYGLQPNQLRIRLQPDAGIEMDFLSKKPGLGEIELEALRMNMSDPESHHKHSYDAYARLMLEAINGDQTLFVSAEEVDASWAWIDGIKKEWKEQGIEVKPYASGSPGPADSEAMMAKDGRVWSDLKV